MFVSKLHALAILARYMEVLVYTVFNTSAFIRTSIKDKLSMCFRFRHHYIANVRSMIFG